MAQVDDWIKEASETYGVPEHIIRGVMRQESGGRHHNDDGSVLSSEAGALGYMQLMPETAEGLGVNPNDPRENIMGGAHYLKYQLDHFNGDLAKALAAYNAGPGAVEKYDGVPPYAETQNYVKSIMGSLGQDFQPQQAGNVFGAAFDPKTDRLRPAENNIEVMSNTNGQADQMTQAKDKFLDSFFDSALGGGLRSVALNVAYSSNNREDGSRKPITDQDVEYVSKMFPGDYVTQKFLLMNANNPQHLAALAQTKKEDIERRQRVEQYGYGVSTAATWAGAILSDPTTLIPAFGQWGMAAKGIARLGKLAGAVPMSTWVRYGSKAAKYAEAGAVTGGFNVLDRYGAEKLGGYDDQDYTSAFILGGLLGSGVSAGADLFRHFKEPATNRLVSSIKNAEDHVAAQATGAELPNAVRNPRAYLESIHDPNFHGTVKSDVLETLTKDGKVFSVSKDDMLNLAKKWGVDFKDNAKAFYKDGITVLVKDNIKAGDRVDDILLHEIGVHGGMQKAVGENAWNNILDTVQQHIKNPQGAWKEAIRRTPDGGLEEILAHYVELSGSKNNKFMTGIKSSVGKAMRDLGITKKVSDAEILDFAHKALKAEVDKARGFVEHPDDSVTQGGLRYSAESVTNPRLVDDVARSTADVLRDTQGGTGMRHKVGQWFEDGWFSGTLGGILKNSKIKEVSKFANDVLHDARQRLYTGNGPKPIELQKHDIMHELSVHYDAFLTARDEYIAKNMSGTRYGYNADMRRLDVNKKVYDYLNWKYGDHKTGAAAIDESVANVAEAYKKLYDSVLETGKTSAERFGYSHANMIDPEFKPRTGEMWRVIDPEQRYNCINTLFGDEKAFQNGLEDYANMFADRKAMGEELLEIRQKEWDVKKAEYDAKVEAYKKDLENHKVLLEKWQQKVKGIKEKATHAVSSSLPKKPVKPIMPKPLDPRPTEVTKADLDAHIGERAHDWAYGVTDQDISNIHSFDKGDAGLTFFRQRFPMDTSGEMATDKGLKFSFDNNLRSYDLDRFTPGILNRFAGEAAFLNKFPEKGSYDTWRQTVEQTHYGSALDNKHTTGVTEADKARELKALDQAVAMLRGTRPADETPNKVRLFTNLLRKMSYNQNGANMGWNQVGEIGGALGYSGFRSAMHVLPALNHLVTGLLKGTDHVNAINDVTRHVFGQNVARDVWKTDWTSRTWHDLVGSSSAWRHMDKLESGVNYMGKIVSTFNMMPRITDWMVTGARSEVIADSVEWAAGKEFSKLRNPFSQKKLDAAGVDSATAAKIREDILKYTEFDSKGNMTRMDVEKWQQESPGAFAKWRFLLDNQSMRTVQQTTIGNTAYLTSAHGYSTFMKMLFQFKDFSLKAINGSTLRALTHREIDDVVSMVGSMAANTAVYAGLTAAKSYMYYPDDKQKQQEYRDKMLAPERLASAALLRGVMTGSILGFGGDIATGVLGTESFRTTYDNSKAAMNRKFTNQKDRDMSDVVGDTFGQNPALRVIESAYKTAKVGAEAIAPHQHVTKREMSDALKAFPLQNALPMLYLNSEISSHFREKELKGDYWFTPNKTSTGRY